MTGQPPADELFQTLRRFGEVQLRGMVPAEVTQVTAHLMVATAFFTGATLQLAGRRRLPKAVYLPALQRFLAHTFSLPERNAAGLVESNARLYKRYVLIENIYNQGWQAGKAWTDAASQTPSALAPLLLRYRDLSMSTLGLEGVKEKPVAAPEVEEIAAVEIVPQPAPKPSRRWLWWVLLLAVAAASYYFYQQAL